MSAALAKADWIPEGDLVQGFATYREAKRCFEIETGHRGHRYEIQLDRIMTHRQFTDWIWQLHFKGWLTGQHFKDFLDCLYMVVNRDWREDPQKFYEVRQAMMQGLDEV
jgi:hypothetical protein